MCKLNTDRKVSKEKTFGISCYSLGVSEIEIKYPCSTNGKWRGWKLWRIVWRLWSREAKKAFLQAGKYTTRPATEYVKKRQKCLLR